MKKLKNVLVTLLSVLMMLTLFVGCSDDSAEESDALVYVSFSDGGGSRSLETENETLYGVEDLYWAYTAEKIRGNYTTGQSAKVAKADYADTTGKIAAGEWTDGIVAGSCTDGGTTLLYLTPVKQGPAKGLKNASVGPFSVGQWRIKLYGFKSYNALTHAYEEIIYKGTTGGSWVNTVVSPADDITSIDKNTTATPKTILFGLDGEPSGKGVLAFKPITMTVPEGQEFYGKNYGGLNSDVKPEVRVLVVDMTNKTNSKPTLIAVSTTEIKFADPEATTNVLKAGALVTTPATEGDNRLGTFNFVIDGDNYAKKGADPTAADALKANEFNNEIAELAFITLYKDSFTVGDNAYSMTGAIADWEARYDYTVYTGPTDASGNPIDIPDTLVDFLKLAGTLYIQEDGSVTVGTGTGETQDNPLVQGYALVGNIAAYQVGFTSGVRTILGGDLNDLLGAKGETEKPQLGTAVAKITWKNTELDASGVEVPAVPIDKFNPHAQPGSAYFRADDVGKDYTLYTSLEDAIKDYDEFLKVGTTTTDPVASCVISEKAPYIEILGNIKGAKLQKNTAAAGATPAYAETTTETEIMLLVSGDKFIGDLEIGGNGDAGVSADRRAVVIVPEFNYVAAPAAETEAEKKAREDSQFTKGKFTFSNENVTTATDGSPVVAYKKQVLRNFQFKTDTAWIYTESYDKGLTTGGTLKVDGTGFTTGLNVLHSGIASVVEIRNVNNAADTSANVNKGYMLGTRSNIPAPGSQTTNIGSLTVFGKGRVDLGGRVCVNNLTVSYDSTDDVTPAALALGDVVLKAKSDATVWQYGYVDYDTSATAALPYVALRTATFNALPAGNKSTTVAFPITDDPASTDTGDMRAKNAGFKEICLDSMLSDSNFADSTFKGLYYMYGIKGLAVQLPAFYTDPSNKTTGKWTPKNGLVFMYWSTDDDFDDDDVNFADEGMVVPGTDPETGVATDTVDLCAVWAQPIGGRVFGLTDAFDPDNYYFFGIADGSVNRIAVNGTTETERVDELSAAYYYRSTSATKDVYVAYAKYPVVNAADASVLDKSVTPEVTYYKNATGTFKFAWDEAVPGSRVSATTTSGLGSGSGNTAEAISKTTALASDSILLWTEFKATGGVQPISNFEEAVTGDWFVGSQAEYDKLKENVGSDKFVLWDIWSSEQAPDIPGTPAATPDKDNAMYWNRSSGAWEKTEKNAPKYVIPIRTLPDTTI